jgi:hypothetical protein
MSMRVETIIVGAAALAIVAAGLYVAKKGVAGAAAGAAGAVVDAATGAATGAVVGIGKAVGIPETNLSECERAKAEGRTWDASFACPAGDFLSWTWGGLFSSERGGGASGSW